MTDMKTDIFADTTFGKIALEKMQAHKPLPENFRLYEAGWAENNPDDFENFIVRGCEYRAAKTGDNAGKMCVKVEGTERMAVIHKSELRAAN